MRKGWCLVDWVWGMNRSLGPGDPSEGRKAGEWPLPAMGKVGTKSHLTLVVYLGSNSSEKKFTWVQFLFRTPFSFNGGVGQLI